MTQPVSGANIVRAILERECFQPEGWHQDWDKDVEKWVDVADDWFDYEEWSVHYSKDAS